MLVTIIIANYNGEKFLTSCLNSLLKSSFTNFEVIIVDDGSTDKSLKIINEFQSKDKRFHLLINNTNLGAAASRNRALPYLKGKYVLFLDNDTEIDDKCLVRMIRTLDSDRTIGGCQALLLDFKKRELIQNAGVKLWAATGWGLPKYQWENYMNIKFKKTENIIAISAALMLRKNVLEKVGGFDEDEAVVTEDLDFSWRTWLTGYRIVLCSTAYVFHWTKSVEMRQNMQHNNRKIYFHLTKNSLVSIIKNYQLVNAIKYSFSSVSISSIRAILVLIRRKDNSALLGTIDAFLWVFMNFFKVHKKRIYVQKTRMVTDSVLFKSIIIQKSPFIVYNQHYNQTNLL